MNNEVTLTSSVDKTNAYKSAMEQKKGVTVASKYSQAKSNRQPYSERARKNAKVTIPFEFPEDYYGEKGKVDTPHQSMGARGVLNIANKLGINLFPINTGFFKLEIDGLAMIVAEQGPEAKTQLDTALVKVEQQVSNMLETMSFRASMHEAFKQLIIAGNVLLYINPTGIRVIHLENYTIHRDPMGNVNEIIIEEEVSPSVLPKDFLPKDMQDKNDYNNKEKAIKIYTCVKYKEGKCMWYQEVKGKAVPNTYGMSPADCSPFIPLRWSQIEGEHYGRSYIEQWYGDLTALENLYQSILEASAMLSKVLFMVSPSGTTRPRTLVQAENGAVIQGSANDVTVLQAQGKLNDLSLANNTIDRIENRLQFAFLLNSAVQRPAERVTAEEIRYSSQELEASLGGLYSQLTQELQLPLVKRLIFILQKTRKIPEFPKGEGGETLIHPKPITGMEAIGRGDDRNKLLEFIGAAKEALGPEVMTQYINMEEALRRLAASSSIDTANLVKTPEQLQKEAEDLANSQKTMQEQEMMGKMIASPAAAKLADNFTKQGAPYGPQFKEGINPETGEPLPTDGTNQQLPAIDASGLPAA
tara:strand:+ start:5890 stop:7644 length:1755 start_codon:yes stop_codon:yes gene_type:complete